MAKVQSKQVSARIGGFFFVLPSILAIAIFVYGMIAYTFNVSTFTRWRFLLLQWEQFGVGC